MWSFSQSSSDNLVKAGEHEDEFNDDVTVPVTNLNHFSLLADGPSSLSLSSVLISYDCAGLPIYL